MQSSRAGVSQGMLYMCPGNIEALTCSLVAWSSRLLSHFEAFGVYNSRIMLTSPDATWLFLVHLLVHVKGKCDSVWV